MIDAANDFTCEGVTQTRNKFGDRIVPTSVSMAATLLLEAFQLATNVGRSRWDFAVGLPELTRQGVANNAVRWLACKGYIALASETTLPGANSRTFRSQGSTCFSALTCAAITKKGRRFARELQNLTQSTAAPADGENSARSQDEVAQQPNWDPQRAELRLGTVVIKQFRKSAPVQKLILTVFEEEGWPPRIDDPLPQAPAKDPQRRLLDAIKTLNQGHQRRIIRFCGDGTGRGVKWEFVQGPELARGVDQSMHGSISQWKERAP